MNLLDLNVIYWTTTAWKKKRCLPQLLRQHSLHGESKPFLGAFKLHHMETLIKKWAPERTNPLTYPGPSRCCTSLSQLAVSFALRPFFRCNSQYIWLTWWTVRRAKLISFWVHGSHGDHLMSASKPIWSKHYPSTADYRVGCFAVVCTCALCIASKWVVPHIQKVICADIHLPI